MKTKEEIKSEVLNYLKKSSNHLFKIGDSEHKILLEGDFYIRITGNEIIIGNIDTIITYYDSNAKNVIKNELFLVPRYFNKPIVTIKNYKLSKKMYSEISEAIKGKTEKSVIYGSIKLILDTYK
jgi:hypothetical protein